MLGARTPIYILIYVVLLRRVRFAYALLRGGCCFYGAWVIRHLNLFRLYIFLYKFVN